jgi:uncharacterized alkaline shock family protein YloU
VSVKPATARLPSVTDLAAQLAPLMGEEGPLPPPAERGTTTMADRVVEKVAAAAVGEVELAAGAARRLGHRQRRSARTRVDVDGQLATISVDMSVMYPSPIRSVARVARRHVAARVRELTGLEVRQLDITVRGFPRAAMERRRAR